MKILKQYKFIFIFSTLLIAYLFFQFDNVIENIRGRKELVNLYLGVVIFALSGFILTYLVFFIIKKEIRIHIIAFFLIIYMGSIYSFIFPPLSAPDEIAHYVSAYKFSNELLGKPIKAKSGHVLVRAKDLYIEDVDGMVTLENIKEDNLEYLQKKDASKGRNLATYLNFSAYESVYVNKNTKYNLYKKEIAKTFYPPVNTIKFIYLPQALGISVARIFDLDTVQLLFVGRFFNLLFASLIISVAIFIIPYYKNLLLGISLLPMSLHLFASFSYDAMLIALIFLYIAYIFHLAFVKDKIKLGDIIFLSLLVSIFAPCKIVYTPIIALGLIIPIAKFKNKKNFICSIFVIIFGFFVSMYLVNYKIVSTYVSEVEAVLPYANSSKYTLNFLLENKKHAFYLFYNTLKILMYDYHSSMIGSNLSNLDDLGAPYILICIFSIFLIILGLKHREEKEIKLSKNNIRYILFLFFSSSFLILLSMLIAWTPSSSDVIVGIQGRYFLPILILALAGLKISGFKADRDYSKKIFMYEIIFNIYIVIESYLLAISR